MPDHFHLLLTVGSDSTIERAVQLVKGGFAFRAGQQFGYSAPVWQKGFSEVRVLDAVSLERARAYIRNNPVTRQLVAAANEFPFSSAYPGFALDPPPHGLRQIGRTIDEEYRSA